MPTDEQIARRLAAAWHERCGSAPGEPRHPAIAHAPSLEVLVPAVRALLAQASSAATAVEELARETVAEHDQVWKQQAAGARTGEELHQLDGAAELARHIIAALDGADA